jgi:hypothetical protein
MNQYIMLRAEKYSTNLTILRPVSVGCFMDNMKFFGQHYNSIFYSSVNFGNNWSGLSFSFIGFIILRCTF